MLFILVEQDFFYCCIDNEIQWLPPGGVAFFVALHDILIDMELWNLLEITNCML